MSTLSAYFQTWRLKLSHTKTVTAAFHLNNREAKREVKVYNNGSLLPFCPTPYLSWGKTGQITHVSSPFSNIAQKTIFAPHTVEATFGLGMGADAKTLRIVTLSLFYSTAEYCAPVWCCSADTRFIDSVLNDALRIVNECLRPTPTNHLPILSGIQPAELRRMRTTLLGLPWISGPRSYLM